MSNIYQTEDRRFLLDAEKGLVIINLRNEHSEVTLNQSEVRALTTVLQNAFQHSTDFVCVPEE